MELMYPATGAVSPANIGTARYMAAGLDRPVAVIHRIDSDVKVITALPGMKMEGMRTWTQVPVLIIDTDEGRLNIIQLR